MTAFETMLLDKLDAIANQWEQSREQSNALLASISESLRILCDAVEQAAYRAGSDEEG